MTRLLASRTPAPRAALHQTNSPSTTWRMLDARLQIQFAQHLARLIRRARTPQDPASPQEATNEH